MSSDEKMARHWQLHTAYVQANTIKGYRYLDLSGVVLNRIGEHYNEVGIDLSGGTLSKPKDDLLPRAIRFSSGHIWLHYSEPESLAQVVDSAPEWIRGIAENLEVTKFSRLGLRIVYFLPSKDWHEDTQGLAQIVSPDFLGSKIGPVDDVEDVSFGYGVRIQSGDLIVHLQLGAVRPAGDVGSSVYSAPGLIFDIDLYERGKKGEGLPRRRTNGFIDLASSQASDYLEEIGTTILEGLDG